MVASFSINMLKTIITITILLVLPLQSFAESWPEFPLPPKSHTTPIAENMRYNHIPMRIQQFNSGTSVAKVLKYYRHKWRKGFVENDVQSWKQISRLEGNYFMTVQVKEAGRNKSQGRLSITILSPHNIQQKLGNGIPMMRNTKVLNDIENKDTGKLGRTLFLINDFSAAANANFYKNHYQAHGWQLTMDELSGSHNRRSLVFRKTGDNIDVVIIRDKGKTHILLNYVAIG